MVVIKPEPTQEENHHSVNVSTKPKSTSKPEPSTSTSTVESRDETSAATGYNSDGFETASESGVNDADDDDGDDEHQQQQSVPPIDDAVDDEESKQKALAQANDAKMEGNKLFGDGQYEMALSKYEFALQVAPETPSADELRSMCHANRGICFIKLAKYEDAIKECTKALELNPKYVKVLLRRGEAHEKLEHFEEAIVDMKKVLEVDVSNVHARGAITRLEPLAAEKREKMKEEMIGKLKDMGNTILGKFGMSVDNFKAVQDPKTGSYSVSFQR